MKKYIIGAILVLVLGGGWYIYREYTRKPLNAGQMDADFSASAKDLQAEFDDEDAALKKYQNKVIEVSGTVSDISTNEKSTDISLETNDPMTAVTIQVLPEEKEKAKKYKAGDKITVKGICNGKLSDIELNKGVIIQ